MNHQDLEPTIAAIATAPGPGGIGIIRLSGSDALTILKGVFQPKNKAIQYTSHRFYYGLIIVPTTGEMIDEVLAVYMQGPRSYTGEDIVEIQCHGSYLILQQILSLVLQYGARPARPGEFTKRAFLNGRIDLTRAEAVVDLLSAKTQEGLTLATSQLQGSLHSRIDSIRREILGILAILEVAIDFPEEDADIINPSHLAARLQSAILTPLNTLIASSDRGRIYREGIAVVILGRPNVGKSSLLNGLLQEERAIVTEMPGTTRDTIEEYIDIKGIPVRIIDTAGIRFSQETIEAIGIRRAKEKLVEADLVLLLFDGAHPLTEEDLELYHSIRDKKVILVVNKIDLVPDGNLKHFAETFAGQRVVALSARHKIGLENLEEAIFQTVTGDHETTEAAFGCAPNIRHRTVLVNCRQSIERTLTGLNDAISPDLLAVELQTALAHLGDIIGLTTTEDVLDMIFNEFCIGK